MASKPSLDINRYAPTKRTEGKPQENPVRCSEGEYETPKTSLKIGRLELPVSFSSLRSFERADKLPQEENRKKSEKNINPNVISANT